MYDKELIFIIPTELIKLNSKKPDNLWTLSNHLLGSKIGLTTMEDSIVEGLQDLALKSEKF